MGVNHDGGAPSVRPGCGHPFDPAWDMSQSCQFCEAAQIIAGTPGPMAPRTQAPAALELMARAEKAEQALASTRATLTEHVDENLELHRRVADLEADRERWRALASTMEPQVSELGVLRLRVEKAITWLVTVKSAQPAGIIAERARLALEALRG